MRHDVYICYSNKDREIADRVCESLEAENFSCWIAPRNISSDESFSDQIFAAIKDAKSFLLIFSDDAQKSIYVKREVEAAFSNNAPIIAVNIDGAVPEGDLAFLLSKAYWISASSDSIDEISKQLAEDLNVLLTEVLKAAYYKEKPRTEGIVKHKPEFYGENENVKRQYPKHAFIYLSYEKADLDFVNAQISQYESQEINFDHKNIDKIKDSSLLVVFVSKNSHKSSNIKKDVVNAISNGINILLVYLDDVEVNFGRLFKLRYASNFRDSIKFSIPKYEMDELSYIDKYDEIFQLYGVKKDVTENKGKVNLQDYLVESSNGFALRENVNLSQSSKGIDITDDDIIIDGKGHSISSSGSDCLFNIASKNVLLKNIDFRHCSSAVIRVNRESSLTLDCCRFEANNGCVIFNSGEINVIESSFIANGPKEHIISSDGILLIKNCEFKANAGNIFNEGDLKISDSLFEDNSSRQTASPIHNEGRLHCYDCIFSKHASENLIFNESQCVIIECTFKHNRTDVTISNNGRLNLVYCEFRENDAVKANLCNDGSCNVEGASFDLNVIEEGYEIRNNDMMSLKKCKIHGKIFNDGNLKADPESYESIEDLGAMDFTLGMDKPSVQPEGKAKQESSYIYLTYDDEDLEFIKSQVSHYEGSGINFTCNDNSKIEDSAILVAFISKNSNQSLKIEEDIEKAMEFDKRMMLIYLDNVRCDFEETLDDSLVFSINHYELSELEYIERCTEIFHVFGIRTAEVKKETRKDIRDSEIIPEVAWMFEDLENLVKGNDEITLTQDILLIESEKYDNGINLNTDGFIINGNGHTISAKGMKGIFNVSSKNVTLRNLNFKHCTLNGSSSMIHVGEDAELTLENCSFCSNDLDDGHAIFTLGNLRILNSIFEDNRSKNEGPAIYARNGSLDIEGTHFNDNVSGNSGGAILNWARLVISDCLFKNNSAEGYGGAIGNVIDAVLKVKSTEFISNHAVSDACAIYNENRASCNSCSFENHASNLSLIFNESKFDLFNCNFENNSSRLIVQNNENGVLYLSNSKFIGNEVNITNVYNNGELATLDKVKFENNDSANARSLSIFNESYMRLRQPQLRDKSIFNTGHIDLWKYDPELINGEGTISIMDGKCDKEHSFDWLARTIADSSDDLIVLDNDIKLENCELDFYEGGIELARDNLVIDGRGHYIDGARRTSLFRVTAKNVTLKNIVFTNANLINDFERHTSGGSAIRTTAGSSLNVLDCVFESNFSADDAGAILNRSELDVINSRFEGNISEGYAGAICNKGALILKSNEFKDNPSRIKEGILNAGSIDGDIDDVYDISADASESESYGFLAQKISKSSDVVLNRDIKFDYRTDSAFKDGITISDADALTIDGNGFQINGDDRASFFKLKNSNVLFKNVTFKNAFSVKSSLFENDAKVQFVNCRFINNHATLDNSLIENDGAVEFKGCQFINNISKNRSLISNNSDLAMVECKFMLNSNEKSIIANSGNLLVENSRFENNHSYENASAIKNAKEGHLLVKYSSFRSNSTSSSGGAIFNQGKVRFENCKFESNSAEGDGGIINNEKDANLEMIESKILNNASKGDGGAIINWGNLTFINSRFTANSARKDGGVVNVQSGSLKIIDCSFDKNNAFDGASIFNRGDLEISNSGFEENASKKDGGVLNTYDGRIQISNSLFKGNTASDGGAIYSRQGSAHISNCKFIDNSADINGGAIINWCEMAIEDCDLLGNSAVIYGGAINNQNAHLTIANSILSDNKADTGGAVFNVDDDKLNVIDCKFENNSPDDVY